jgi:hypothetical protein
MAKYWLKADRFRELPSELSSSSICFCLWKDFFFFGKQRDYKKRGEKLQSNKSFLSFLWETKKNVFPCSSKAQIAEKLTPYSESTYGSKCDYRFLQFFQ